MEPFDEQMGRARGRVHSRTRLCGDPRTFLVLGKMRKKKSNGSIRSVERISWRAKN